MASVLGDAFNEDAQLDARPLFRRLSRRASSPSVFDMSVPELHDPPDHRDKALRRLSVASSTRSSIRVEMFPKFESEALTQIGPAITDTSLDSSHSIQSSRYSSNRWLFADSSQVQNTILTRLLSGSNPNLAFRRRAFQGEQPEVARFSIMDVPAKEIAGQLTVIDAKLFRKVRREEFASLEWSGRNKLQSSPNIVHATNFFNQVALWVSQEILNSNEIKQRCGAISHFIAVLKSLLDLNNFNGVRSVLAGLQSTPVFRLTRTWECLGKRDKILYDKMSTLMANESNSEAYRKKLSQAKPPCIPYLGIYLGDLTFTYEAWKSVRGDESKLNQCIEREAQMEALLDEIGKLQTLCVYNIAPNDTIQTGITAQFYPPESIAAWENEQYQTSYLLEPKKGQSVQTGQSEVRVRSATEIPPGLPDLAKFQILKANLNLRMPKFQPSIKEESQLTTAFANPFRSKSAKDASSHTDAGINNTKLEPTKPDIPNNNMHMTKIESFDRVKRTSINHSDPNLSLSASMKSDNDATLMQGSLDNDSDSFSRVSSTLATFGSSRRKEQKLQRKRETNRDSSLKSVDQTDSFLLKSSSTSASLVNEYVEASNELVRRNSHDAHGGLRISVEIPSESKSVLTAPEFPWANGDSFLSPKILTRATSETFLSTRSSGTNPPAMKGNLYIKYEVNEDGTRPQRRPWIKCTVALYSRYISIDTSRGRLSIFFSRQERDEASAPGSREIQISPSQNQRVLESSPGGNSMLESNEASSASSKKSRKRWGFFQLSGKEDSPSLDLADTSNTVPLETSEFLGRTYEDGSKRYSGDIAAIEERLKTSLSTDFRHLRSSVASSAKHKIYVDGAAGSLTSIDPDIGSSGRASAAHSNGNMLFPSSSKRASASYDFLPRLSSSMHDALNTNGSTTPTSFMPATRKNVTLIDLTPGTRAELAEDYTKKPNVIRVTFHQNQSNVLFGGTSDSTQKQMPDQQLARSILLRPVGTSDSLSNSPKDGEHEALEMSTWIGAINNAVSNLHIGFTCTE
ncbi:RasGEF [Phlyctochytrium planicorne]|nr:RasGEF [Phlyctochytrium planicorne]